MQRVNNQNEAIIPSSDNIVLITNGWLEKFILRKSCWGHAKFLLKDFNKTESAPCRKLLEVIVAMSHAACKHFKYVYCHDTFSADSRLNCIVLPWFLSMCISTVLEYICYWDEVKSKTCDLGRWAAHINMLPHLHQLMLCIHAERKLISNIIFILFLSTKALQKHFRVGRI